MPEADKSISKNKIINGQNDLPTFAGVPVHSNDLAWRMLEAENVDLQKQITIAQIDLPTLTGNF